ELPNDGSEIKYIVPAMNRKENPELIPRDSQLNSFFLNFMAGMSTGVFERVLCLLLKNSKNMEGCLLPEITTKAARVTFKGVHVYLENLTKDNEIRVSVAKVQQEFRTVLAMFEDLLEELKTDAFISKVHCCIVVEGLANARCELPRLKEAVEKK